MDLALFARVLALMLAAFFLGAALGGFASSRIGAAHRRGKPEVKLAVPPTVAPDRPFFVDATVDLSDGPWSKKSGLAILVFEGVGMTPSTIVKAFRVEEGKHCARFEVSVPSAMNDTAPQGRVQLFTGEGAITSSCVKVNVDPATGSPEITASST